MPLNLCACAAEGPRWWQLGWGNFWIGIFAFVGCWYPLLAILLDVYSLYTPFPITMLHPHMNPAPKQPNATDLIGSFTFYAKMRSECLQCLIYRQLRLAFAAATHHWLVHLRQFQQFLGHISMGMDLERLNDGSGMEAKMLTHFDGLHKTYMYHQQTRLDWLRHSKEPKPGAPLAVNISGHSKTATKAPTCVFWNAPADTEDLYEVTTHEMYINVLKLQRN